MPNKILITALLFVVACIGLAATAVAAPAVISGALEWRIGDHTATENGSKVLDASHFTQKYSFLAEKQGYLGDGRLGDYSLALGYEWSWVDLDSENGSQLLIGNPLDKILYRGEISLTPGGLPFNFHAYSHDMTSTAFVEKDLGELFNERGSSSGLGTVTDIANGTHRVTGLTLNVGAQNGHYEGKYRDILSTVPRLLLDFRQVDVHDLNSLNPRDYTDRDLAFVSLNKKNNWFHYKVFTHDDRIDPTANFSEQEFLLGTIDQHNRRQWVNMTNWIQVSSDIAYSETLTESSGSSLQHQKRYDINLFTRANRTRWQASNFTTFSRVNDGNSMDRSLTVPFYASGELSRDTAWRVRMVGSRTESKLFSSGLYDQQSDDLYATAKVDTYRQARYVFSPSVSAESKQGLDGEGYALSASAEFHNNPAYRSPYDLFGRYDVRWFTGIGDNGLDTSYFEQEAEGSLEKDFNSQLRVGISQYLLYANGTYSETVADNISAASSSILNYHLNAEGDALRSLTTIFADHRALNRVNNRLEISLDYQSGPSFSGSQWLFTHSLSFRKAAWIVTADSRLGFGDELAISSASLGGGLEGFFTNFTKLSYRPSRIVSSSLGAGYERRTFSANSSMERFTLNESAEYSLWQRSGLLRKLASFGQSIEATKTLQTNSSVASDTIAFTLLTNYYPTRISILSAKLRYELDNAADNATLTAFLSAGIDFQKLQVSLDYSYGDRSVGLSEPERMEQRWELKVRKTF